MFFQSAGIFAVVEVVLILHALVVVPRNHRPSSALAWILLIILLPVIGALFFLVIGSPKLPRHRRAVQRSMDDRIKERARDVGQVSAEHPVPPWLPSVARLNQTVGAMPLLEDNQAHLLPHITEQLVALSDAVNQATATSTLSSTFLSRDASTAPFFAALEAAVARGVQVRALARPHRVRRRGLAGVDPAGMVSPIPRPRARGRPRPADLRGAVVSVFYDAGEDP